ncbi:MAG: LysR substrate-binding domain-containing protein [Deferribacterales bacterium]
MNITLRQIEVFLAVAAFSHVGRAAESLNISQSAVSMALGQFEEAVKERLFDRSSRKVFLNDAGKKLLPFARKAYEAAAEVENFRSDGKIRGSLKIGASTTIGNYLMPFIIGRFSEMFPETLITMEVGNTAVIAERVSEHELDLGFTEGPVHDDEITELFWRKDRLTVFSPKSFIEESYRPDIPSWIIREKGSGTREVFEAAMSKAGTGFKIKMELGHTEAIKKAVEAGLGIGCLSELAVSGEISRGVFRRLNLNNADFSRDLNIITRKDKHLTASMKAFIDYCLKEDIKTAGYPD